MFVFLQKDYEELATSVMSIVDRLVHKTNVPLSLSLSLFSLFLSLPLSLMNCYFIFQCASFILIRLPPTVVIFFFFIYISFSCRKK